MRSAESTRVSSCLFADRIASLSINAYETNCIIRNAYKQTVLATIVLFNHESNEASVVALGVGTKILSSQIINEKRVHVVRDLHAEVLCRRAFLKYCHRQIENLLHEKESIFTLNNDLKIALKKEYTLHLYSSSQPCGNACIKRWVKGKKPEIFPDLNENEYPIVDHKRINIAAREEGQVSILLKRDPLAAADEDGIHDVDLCKFIKPVGTEAPNSTKKGMLKTCSDKIAKWNAIGIQGSYLSLLLASPLYLSTITIGRKFGQQHAERALCCRLQDFVKDESRPGYFIHHPVMMGTQVKFDKSVIYTSTSVGIQSDDAADESLNHAKKHKSNDNMNEIGANFSERKCFTWWNDAIITNNYSILDSESGLEIDELSVDSCSTRESPLSSYMLHKSFQNIRELLKVENIHGSPDITGSGVEEVEKYWQDKIVFSSPHYQQAKHEIQSKKQFFYNWK